MTRPKRYAVISLDSSLSTDDLYTRLGDYGSVRIVEDPAEAASIVAELSASPRDDEWRSVVRRRITPNVFDHPRVLSVNFISDRLSFDNFDEDPQEPSVSIDDYDIPTDPSSTTVAREQLPIDKQRSTVSREPIDNNENADPSEVPESNGRMRYSLKRLDRNYKAKKINKSDSEKKIDDGRTSCGSKDSAAIERLVSPIDKTPSTVPGSPSSVTVNETIAPRAVKPRPAKKVLVQNNSGSCTMKEIVSTAQKKIKEDKLPVEESVPTSPGSQPVTVSTASAPVTVDNDENIDPTAPTSNANRNSKDDDVVFLRNRIRRKDLQTKTLLFVKCALCKHVVDYYYIRAHTQGHMAEKHLVCPIDGCKFSCSMYNKYKHHWHVHRRSFEFMEPIDLSKSGCARGEQWLDERRQMVVRCFPKYFKIAENGLIERVDSP